jgi:ABC-type uncharacterized transport system ATPase subunit
MREMLEKFASENDVELLFCDGHDNAILGLGRKFNSFSIIYSTKKVIENLMSDMDYDDAIEYFEFNIAGAYVGDATPTFMIDDGFGE